MAIAYTPSGITRQTGEFPTGRRFASLTWDGQQLVAIDEDTGDLFTLPRNADGTYTPANAASQGTLPAAHRTDNFAVTWDGTQLVVLSGSGHLNVHILTLPRNADGTYTPANAASQGTLPGLVAGLNGITWDGGQLVFASSSVALDRIYRLERNANGGYSPANAVDQIITGLGLGAFALTWDGEGLVFSALFTQIQGGGVVVPNVPGLHGLTRNSDGSYDSDGYVLFGPLPTGMNLSVFRGIAWDGTQLVMVDRDRRRLYTLFPDNRPPVITDITRSDVTIFAGQTVDLEALASDPDGDMMTYAWSVRHDDNPSDLGALSATNIRAPMWTAPAVLPATIAPVTTYQMRVTVSDPDDESATLERPVIVTEAGPALALPVIAAQTSETGDSVTLAVPEATGGFTPYIHTVSGLPPGLAFRNRRIAGIPSMAGVYTVTHTVTDSGQRMASNDFTYTITGDPLPVPTGLNLRIDWGDLFYASEHSDVTGRITNDILFERGRGTASSILARSQAGQMAFDLQNSDGLFDQDNPTSPLRHLLHPGVQVQLRDGATPLWTGVLDTFPTQYSQNGQHRAKVTALGILSETVDPEVVAGSLTPESTAQAFIDLCELAGVPFESAQPAPGDAYVMNRWWVNSTLRQALNAIEDTEGGFVFEDREGELGFHLATYRAGRTKVKTFVATTPGTDEIRIRGNPRRELAIKDIRNQVIAEVRQFQPAMADQEIAVVQGRVPVIHSRDTVLEVISQVNGAIQSINPPVGQTDYKYGDGTTVQAGVNLQAEIEDFNVVKMTLAQAVTLDGPEDFYDIALKGTVLNLGQPFRIVREDAASIRRYKRKPFSLKGTWLNTIQEAETRADALLARLATPERRVSLDWHIEDWADFLAMDLSDRVGVNMPNLVSDGFIEAIKVHIPLNRAIITCTMDISLVN